MLSIPLHRSFRTKLIVVSILVEILMLGILLGNSVRLMNHVLEQETIARLNSVTPLLDSALGGPLFARDHVTIAEILKKLAGLQQLSGFAYLVVYDNYGNVYAQQGDVDPNRMPAIDSAVMSGLNDMIYDVISPLTLSGQKVGEVRFGLSLSTLIASQETIFQQGFIIASIEVILTFLLLSIAGYFLTGHIRTLVQGTQRIASGDYSRKIPVQTKDEVGLLAANFNEMTQAIKGRIDALHLAEQKVYEEKIRAEVTLDSLGEGVITTDVVGYVQYLNPVAEKLIGLSNAEAHNQLISDIYQVRDEPTQAALENIVFMTLHNKQVVSRQAHAIFVTDCSQQFAIEETAAPIKDQNDQVVGTVLVFRDVTPTREFARRLHHQAAHDTLTGLVNRAEFERILQNAVIEAGDSKHEYALCYLDLDQFKVVNDTSGHCSGDELLRQLSRLIKTKVRDADTFGRLGGDEFGLLLSGCDIEQAATIAQNIRDVVRDFRFVWKDKSFAIGVNIGVVPIHADSGSMVDILSEADVACYVAKDQGRNQIHVHQSDDIEHAKRYGEMHWSTRICTALSEDRFVLYYQKITPIMQQDKSPIHAEILLRMIDENNNIVKPEMFVGAAERYHHMTDIDRWVIRQTLSLMSNPSAAGEEDELGYSINLSGQSLGDNDFLLFVKQQIHSSQINPSRICFEITETAAIANLSRAVQFIDELKALGCRFALDDFGSGLSSFAYLKTLPIDYLKIDGSFVREIAHDKNQRAMVAAINQIGHVMGIQTIAEFVEDEAIYNILRETGVDYGQGYLIHTPQKALYPAIA